MAGGTSWHERCAVSFAHSDESVSYSYLSVNVREVFHSSFKRGVENGNKNARRGWSNPYCLAALLARSEATVSGCEDEDVVATSLDSGFALLRPRR